MSLIAIYKDYYKDSPNAWRDIKDKFFDNDWFNHIAL